MRRSTQRRPSVRCNASIIGKRRDTPMRRDVLSRCHTMNQLKRPRLFTTVVADSGNFLQMAQYAPRDATTDPPSILVAAQQADCAPLLDHTVADRRRLPPPEIVDEVLVRFELQIFKRVDQRGTA